MKLKVFLMILSCLLVFSSLNFGAISANANTTATETHTFVRPIKQIPGIETLSEEVIELADQFITLENDRFVVDGSGLMEATSAGTYVVVKNHINQKNEELALFSAEQMDQGEVIDNYIEFTDNTATEAAKKTYGVNRLRTYWWGYKVYLNNNISNTTAQLLAGGAGTSAIVALWLPVLTVPTVVLKAIAGTFVIAFGGASGMIYKTNKGKGIYLRFTGRYPTTFYTGMFAQ